MNATLYTVDLDYGIVWNYRMDMSFETQAEMLEDWLTDQGWKAYAGQALEKFEEAYEERKTS